MYEKWIKRALDIVCAVAALTVFSWLYLIVYILVYIRLGSPVIFKQPRPGKKDKDGNERIFCMYKFRTMTMEQDENGKPLPDEQRMTRLGSILRKLSLDELPEAVNILKGDMSVIGPRPQLVRDMVFMSETQRQRHNVRPGLSGLAQVSGRNAISWDGKLDTDLRYIQRISFWGDLRIVLKTVKKVLQREGIAAEGHATAEDFGDALLESGRITQAEYDAKQREARELLEKWHSKKA